MKKTMSMTIEGITYHLVAYYRPSDVRSGKLQTPSNIHGLSSLRISPELLSDLSQFRHPPIFDIGHDGSLHHVADREERISVVDLSSKTLYRMSSRPPTPHPPELYTPLSEVPYYINRVKYMATPAPSPASTTGDLPRTPELTPSPTSNSFSDQHPSDYAFSVSPSPSPSRDGHWDGSLFNTRDRCQIQPTGSWQNTSDHMGQAPLDQFILAYNSPVYWDISWGGQDFGVQPFDQELFHDSDLSEMMVDAA